MLKLSNSPLSGNKALSLEGDALVGDGEAVYVHLRSNHHQANEPPQAQVTESNPPATSFCWDQDYSRLEISPRFRRLVEGFDTSNPIRDPAKTLKFTFKGYYHYVCQNRSCPLVDAYLPAIDCGRYHPHRSFKHVSRCAGRVMDQIEFLEKKLEAQRDPTVKIDYLICLDLTCPKEVSDHVQNSYTIKHLRLAVNRFIECLRVLLSHGKRRFSRLGGFYTIHIWATNNPLEPHLHVHLQLLNVAFNGKKRRFYRFSPMISHSHVKQAWKRALKFEGLWHDLTENSLPDCYLHYVRLKDRARVIHRLRYIFRKPIVDLNIHLDPGDLHDLDPGWIRTLLDYTPRRVKIGFMTNLKRLGYLCPKSFSERCPFCGGSLKKVGFSPGNLPLLPHFIRDRGGGWFQVDPPGQ
ncbi:hypothetical protein ES703_103894 [subsurface metagenome]